MRRKPIGAHRVCIVSFFVRCRFCTGWLRIMQVRGLRTWRCHIAGLRSRLLSLVRQVLAIGSVR